MKEKDGLNATVVMCAVVAALGSFTHWLFAALLTLVFPKMAETLHPGTIFAFFCSMMVLHLLWVIFLVPETKGRRLEEITLNVDGGTDGFDRLADGERPCDGRAPRGIGQ